MSWVLNLIVILLCVAAIIAERKQTGRTEWVTRENYLYIITALITAAYGVVTYLFGKETSMIYGLAGGNTMTALALGIVILSKMLVDVKGILDKMGVEEEMYMEENTSQCGEDQDETFGIGQQEIEDYRMEH